MNIPLVMVIAFLVLTLIVGLYFSRKITTLREYAVGSKNFSTATLVATVLATAFGGAGLIRNVQVIYSYGLYKIIWGFLASMDAWIVGLLALRMGPFMHHLSLPETIGSVYGIYPRLVTALASICSAIAGLAGQISATSLALGMCIDFVDHQLLHKFTILATFVLICYSTFGGIRAVTFTDVLQFLTFTIIIPILTIFMFHKTGKSVSEMVCFLQNYKKFQFKSLLNFETDFIAMTTLFLALLVGCMVPSSVQRIYMSSSPTQARSVYSYATFFAFFIKGCITLISVFVFVQAPTLPVKDIWPYIMHDVHPLFKGLLAISMLAMAMSTADSKLNTCSVIVSHDVIGCLKNVRLPVTHTYLIVRLLSKAINPLLNRISSINALLLVRYTSFTIGCLAMFMVFKNSDLLTLLKRSLNFQIPIIPAPFLLAIFGFRSSSATALIGMVTGIITIWAWNQWIEPATGIDGSFFCMLANGLAMMIAHYLLPQPAGTGWVAPDDTYTAYKQNKAYAAKLRKESLRAIFSYPKAYLIALKPSDFKLIGSGLYIIINGLIKLAYCWDKGWYLGPIALFLIGFSLASYVLFFKKYPIPDWIVTLYLWLALLCALPIHSLCSWYYLPLPLLTLALSYTHIALLISLLPCYIALFMAMPLFYLYACCCYKISFLCLSVQLFLPLLGSGILLFGFMLYAKRRIDQSAAQRKLLELRNAYEQRVSLETIYNQASLARLNAYTGSHLLTAMGKTLQETLQNLDTATPIKKEVKLFLKKLDRVGHIWMEHAHTERKMALHPKAITSIDITSTIVKIYSYTETLDNSIQFFLRNQSSTTYLEADSALLECLVMLNIWELSKSRPGPEQELTLTLADTTLHYGHSPTGAEEATDTSSLTLPAVAFAFATDRTVKAIRSHYTVTHIPAYKTLPKEEVAFYQLESRQIVEAHGGYTEILDIADNLTCLYVLPVKGKQVMHLKTYDSADLVAAKVAETEESIAQEQELISLLTSNTTLTQEKVTEAIAFIKKAHGLVKRKSGAPYYTHPMEVVKILLEVTKDPDTILAGLLHDVVEDTPITLHQIEMLYGEEVASMVDKVTEYNTHGYPWKLEKIEQNSILNVCGDIRVVQVKLADRLHNMRTLYARKPESQQRIAKETLTFYIPWGERNKGPEVWLKEMQEICERIIN